ncbi:hypothetical protein I7I50_08204 [Histoplasma capsulatum G186AR]|uniref:Integral membrane protein n=1 Tax=Ajellomyces capsulatus TaxID=5037 RepID=A0A8H7YQI1_AJECA|nr:hypothetical protein I7I52_05721 [Histoplasma capsulatum]QSS73427.1 hypothetical protein I7I50_08204 [Histoplasma capsulatum G186AR]
MAPRRSGGGGIFISSSSASCSSSAFIATSSKIYLGYFATFFIIDSALLWIASRLLFKLQRGRPLLRWLLILSIILTVFDHAWDVLFLVLGECSITGVDLSVKLALVSSFLDVVAISLLVGVVMVSLCKRLHHIANMAPRLIAILHGLWAAGFACFYFIAMCLYAAITTKQLDFSSSYGRRKALASLVMGWNGMMTLAGVVLLLGMLSTAFNLVGPLSRCRHQKSSSLSIIVSFLALSSVCFGASFLAHQILVYRMFWKTTSVIDARDGYYALVFLNLFFYSSTFLFALLVTVSPAFSDNEPSNDVHHPVPQQLAYALPVQQNPPDPHILLMQQNAQQPYPPVGMTQPYQPTQQHPYHPHHNTPPAPYY